MRIRSYLAGVIVPLLSCAVITAEDKQLSRQEPQCGVLHLRFGAYELNRVREKSTFQITIVDRKNASWFQKVGDPVPGTRCIIQDFVKKTIPGDHEDCDVSELILIEAETERQVVLPLGVVVEVPLTSSAKQ